MNLSDTTDAFTIVNWVCHDNLFAYQRLLSQLRSASQALSFSKRLTLPNRRSTSTEISRYNCRYIISANSWDHSQSWYLKLTLHTKEVRLHKLHRFCIWSKVLEPSRKIFFSSIIFISSGKMPLSQILQKFQCLFLGMVQVSFRNTVLRRTNHSLDILVFVNKNPQLDWCEGFVYYKQFW